MLLGIASGDWLSPQKSYNGKEQWGGAGWARLGQFIPHLPMVAAVGVLVWNRTHFSIQEANGELFDPDVVIMQRLMHDGISENIPKAQAYGQKIINDVDDWFWGLSTSNQAFHVNHPKNKPTENIYTYKTTIHRSDLITVSTPYLAERFAAMGIKNVIITKNTVDVDRFLVKEHTDSDVPQVGWVGSTSHRSNDLETMKGILVPMARAGKITLYHGGNTLESPTFASKIGADDSEVTTAPLCPHSEYPKLLSMDIGIVPLSDTPFNRAKSNIKGLEYAASGVPFIAQNLDAYAELQSDLGIGRVAKNATKWIKHLNDLRDPVVRASEGAAIRELVRQRDITVGLRQFIEAVESV